MAGGKIADERACRHFAVDEGRTGRASKEARGKDW